MRSHITEQSDALHNDPHNERRRGVECMTSAAIGIEVYLRIGALTEITSDPHERRA